MGRKPFVGDGYDDTIYIKADELYPACRITGRKMAGFQATVLVKEAMARERDAGAEVHLYAERIAERIRSWHYLDDDSGEWRVFEDERGNPLPVNALSFGGLQPKLMWRIRDIIMGTEPGDIDPLTGVRVESNEDDAKN